VLTLTSVEMTKPILSGRIDTRVPCKRNSVLSPAYWRGMVSRAVAHFRQ